MAWHPIAFVVPQYFGTNGNPASGFVLKAYQVGTTTNIPFATDNEGTTTVNTIALNAKGYPEVSGNIIIPHMDQDFKLALYPSQSAADSDTGAEWTIDDIDLIEATDPVATAADYNVWPLVDYGGMYLDGTNDYLTRGAGLTGASDGKKGTIVAFVTFDAAASAVENIIHATGFKFRLMREANGVFRVSAENAAGTTILNLSTANAYEATDTVYCVMASWDMAVPGSGQLYVNDASDLVTTTFTNDTIDYTVADWAVGADTGGSNKTQGNILLVWFDSTDNLDFDTELNRRRFLDEQDNPVYLGVRGELPTTSQPILFLGNKSQALFNINRGSGGNFSVTGSPAAPTVTLKGQHDGGLDTVITTRGDLIIGGPNTEEARLPVGAADTLLLSDGTTLAYGKIGAANVTANSLGQSEIANGAVGQGELTPNSVGQAEEKSTNSDHALGNFSVSDVPEGYRIQTTVTTTGGVLTRGFSLKYSAIGTNVTAFIAYRANSTGFTSEIALLAFNSGASNESLDGVTVRERYLQASPPYDLGFGEIPLFVFLLLDKTTRNIRQISVAPDPPWAYNGPTDISGKRDQNGKLVKVVSELEAKLLNGDLTKAQVMNLPEDQIQTLRESSVTIEVDQTLKNKDMDLIPHPFVDFDPNTSLVAALDPDSLVIQRLADIHRTGESVTDLINDNFLRIGSTPVARGFANSVTVLSAVQR